MVDGTGSLEANLFSVPHPSVCETTSREWLDVLGRVSERLFLTAGQWQDDCDVIGDEIADERFES